MNNLKKFVIKKYIMAKNAKDAIRKENKISPDDVWIDEDWKIENDKKEIEIGFKNK